MKRASGFTEAATLNTRRMKEFTQRIDFLWDRIRWTTAHARGESKTKTLSSQGYTDRADSYYLYPSGNNVNDSEMASLPTDMELELALSQRNSTRTPSPQPQLTPCEQLKYNKAQLVKLEAFRRCKQAYVDVLMMMPDHYPEEPFYVRALTELQDVEETMGTSGTAVTDQQKANLLATNIKNNFVENERENDNYNQNDELISTIVNNFLSTPPTSFIEPALPDEIIHYIKHVNAKKAPGKDSITNRMLKNFPIKLILILTILINKILKFNFFPDNWKEAIIFPINKPGKDPHLACSYRPISLLSTIGKLTESIILHRLKNFINENNLLNPNQYGFTNKLSTLYPLLRLTEHISEGFQKKKSTGAVFLDIQKAFDRVWINGLPFKLISYKILPPTDSPHSLLSH
ncbi:probable RNA-directed DNA polymerase from transposon BS [Trichonephila clavipes]|uniref:Probable RNA-directed DNA polymerase from transposon BS n=1 Tax=Trichonephila clavipes TaxID=2585209 RepID=A0A8X6VVZ7_TRICX|nr:probable RNA-directed DNA polymerase from transposon BS [Trichonephila clavipes]